MAKAHLAVDEKGRLFVVTNASIEVFGPKGEALGSITLPKKAAEPGFRWCRQKLLYIVGRGAAYRIATDTAGYSGRAK